MLLDNDSGPKDLLNHLKDKVKNCPNDVDTIRKARYTHIFDNLYLLLTPLLHGGKESCMEDLLIARYYQRCLMERHLINLMIRIQKQNMVSMCFQQRL